jgi:uncharacterized protein YbjT (DUF2867 family)
MYVLLGSTGNITSKTAALLLARGAAVRVVGRNRSSLAALAARGADIAAVDLAERDLLARALEGATGVYAMIPTDYTAPDLAADQDRIGAAIAGAIRSAGVERVVNLSSIGAHLPAGTGPIAGLHRQEQRLDALHGVDVLHVRPGYFFENHLAAIDTIATTGAYADMTAPDAPLPMVATADIAQLVARELRAPTGAGRRVRHLRAPRLYSMREAAALLGQAIGQPNLRYVQVDAQQGKQALTSLGFSASAAAQFEEMSAAFSTGLLDGEHERGPTDIAPTPLEHFANAVFKPAFEARARS